MSPAKPSPKAKLPVFWIVVGAVLAIVLGAILITSMNKDDTPSSNVTAGGADASGEFGSVTVSGTDLPTSEDADDPAVGEIMPTVTGENFSGEPVAIEPNGNAQMIVFLAHWCPHCNAEAPRLAAYLEQNNGVPTGTDLVIVPTGSNANQANWPPSQWVTDMRLAGVTTLVDDGDGTAARAFGLSSYPFIVMVDSDGKVVDRISGEQADGFFAKAFAALADGTAPSN